MSNSSAGSDGARHDTLIGLMSGLGAYALWGLFPLFFKLLSAVSPAEVIAHRLIWAAMLLVVIITFRRRWGQVREILSSLRTTAIFAASALFVSGNWLVFVWAVANGHVLQSSMGYFIFPLVAVLLGTLFLKEPMVPRQWLAVIIVAAGVLWMVLGAGTFPWIALTLAVSFGAYGFIRKLMPAGPMVGLFVETMILTPLALIFLFWLEYHNGGSAFMAALNGIGDQWVLLLLPVAGFLTAVPLLLFAMATQRLNLSTVGLMMYLNPTLQFLLAVLIFDEPFDRDMLVTFLCIWSGLLIFAIDPAKLRRRGAKVPSHH